MRKKSEFTKLKDKVEAAQKRLTIKLYGRDCYTCPRTRLTKKDCQLGHVPWPRAILSVQAVYDTRFTRIQCFQCNIWRGGMGAKALERMQGEGIDTAALWAFSESTKRIPLGMEWFRKKLAEYRELLKKPVENQVLQK